MHSWIKGAKVAILAVGSFNPPTIMHLRMFELAKDHLELNYGCQVVEGIMSPVADGFGKPNLAKAHHRLEMARRAVASSSWIRADGWECQLPAWSRSLLVLTHHSREVKERHGEQTQLVLVCGGDVVDSFLRILPDGTNLWNPSDVCSIVSEFGLIVVTRDGSRPLESLAEIPQLEKCRHQVMVVQEDVCPCDVSSTCLRSAIRSGRSIKYATPDPVIEYIHKNGLYSE